MAKVNSIMQQTLFYWVQSAQSRAQIYLETC